MSHSICLRPFNSSSGEEEQLPYTTIFRNGLSHPGEASFGKIALVSRIIEDFKFLK